MPQKGKDSKKSLRSQPKERGNIFAIPNYKDIMRMVQRGL